MINIFEELQKEIKVQLLGSVIDAEMVRGDFLSSGEKVILFPNKPVFFRFDFSDKELLYPNINLEVVSLDDGSAKLIWSIDGSRFAAKSNIFDLIRYEILPHLEDVNINLNDIVGFYTFWLAKMRLTKRFDLVQKTIKFQTIPNDSNEFYIIFKMAILQKVKKQEEYEAVRYVLKFEKIKRDITVPLPISLEDRIKVCNKITEEINSFLQEVSEETLKIFREGE